MAQAAAKVMPASSFDGVWIGDVPEAEALKRIDRLTCEFRELVKRFEDGFVIERCSWSEAYANARISLVLYFKLPGLFQLSATATARGANPLIGDRLAALVFKNYTESVGLMDRGQDQSMLVETVQLGKLPEHKLTSMVRLYLIDDKVREVGVGSHYRSIMAVLRYYVVPRSAHGERHGFNSGHADGDIVEGGPQVVDDVPNDERQCGWRPCGIDHAKELISGLSIVLDDQLCRIRVDNGAVLLCKLVDVALGPMNL